MRWLLTSLGAWDTIEGEARHKLTYPLALVSRVLLAAGHAFASWEGEQEVAGNVAGFGVIGIGAMDPRHFWRIAPWLRSVGVPDLAAARSDGDPIVILGGQAAYAPTPTHPFVDVIYVGEAEAGLAEVCVALSRGASRRATLEAIAALPGCYVPAVAAPGDTVRPVYATDLRASTEALLSVSKSTNPRVEIARGCKGPAGVNLPAERWKACGFCVLGWRRPYIEAPAAEVVDAVARVRASGSRQLHLSAGDAEGHSGIRQIRAEVARLGIHDHGWTGRLDTIADCHVQPGKLYAFGIEGASYRLRAAIGKPRLTSAVIASGLRSYWDAGGRRVLLHLIGGLPTETSADIEELSDLFEMLSSSAAGYGETIHMVVGRQPFNPMPHTPMQWMPAGIDTTAIGRVLARGRWGDLQIRETPGMQPPEAMLNAVVLRGGPEVWPLLRAGAPHLPRDRIPATMGLSRALKAAGARDLAAYTGPIEVGAPLPWDHVESPFPRDTIAAEHDRIMRMLGRPAFTLAP
jgi:hypothetical protein